jgi:hypothetical protein
VAVPGSHVASDGYVDVHVDSDGRADGPASDRMPARDRHPHRRADDLRCDDLRGRIRQCDTDAHADMAGQGQRHRDGHSSCSRADGGRDTDADTDADRNPLVRAQAHPVDNPGRYGNSHG